MRVRNLKDNEIYTYIYDTHCPVKRSEITLDSVEDHAEILKSINQDYAESKLPTPEWLKKIMLLSQLEDNLSGQRVKTLYDHYFNVLGYTIINDDEDDFPELVTKGGEDKLFDYTDIPSISQAEADQIKESIQCGESTFLDKNKLAKHEFDKNISLLNLSSVRSVFFARYFQKNTDRSKFFRIMKECHAITKPELIKAQDITYSDVQVSRNLLTNIVMEVIKSMGLKHSQDLQTKIEQESIEKIKEKIPSLEMDIKTLIPSSNRGEEISSEPIRLINRLLSHQGFTTCKKQRVRKMTKGKSIDLKPFYQLESEFDDSYSPQKLAESMIEPMIPKGKCILK
jgi:hypothetical protein